MSERKSKTRESKRDLRKKIPKLKNELIYIPNPSKKNHEKWYEGRNMLNLPKPFRCLMVAGVNSSKTNTAKNIVIRCRPHFDYMYVVHQDPRDKEWADMYDEGVNGEIRADLPEVDDFEHDGTRYLVIIEDAEFKRDDPKLSALFRYVSTHTLTSIIMLYQDFYKIPPIARRCSNVFCIWRCPDRTVMDTLSRRIGMNKDEFNSLYDTFIKHPRDFIMFDQTSGSPYPIRLNGFHPISKKSKDTLPQANATTVETTYSQ